MTGNNSTTFGAMTTIAVLALFSASSAVGQNAPRSPSDLIRYLTYQSERPDGRSREGSAVFTCGRALGEARDDRALTKLLVKIGDSALPAIELALDSFEARGEKSEVALNVRWLLLAYARIKGPAAYGRLHKMIGNSRLASYAESLDNAVAVALGLTSYISSFRGVVMWHQCEDDSGDRSLSDTPCEPPSREIAIEAHRCNRGEEPRDALDKVILAWEPDNLPLLEASLGSSDVPAADQLRNGMTWTNTRTGSGSGRNLGVGYRFATSGRWSEPEETLEDERSNGTLDGNYANPEIETVFTKSSGEVCGEFRLRFPSIPITSFPDGPRKYLINGADLGPVLQLIASCASDR